MMESKWPPLAIKLMLACYCSEEPMEVVGKKVWHSEAGQQWRAWLFEHDLISGYDRPTAKGTAWVQAICNVELPK